MNKIQLFLNNLNGKTFVVDIETGSSVEALKTIVYNRTGILPDKQRLVYNSKTLHNGRLLSDYNITDATTVDILLRLLSGGMVFVNFKNTIHKVIVNLDNNNVQTSCIDIIKMLKKDNIIKLCFDCLEDIHFEFNGIILNPRRPLFNYGIRATSIPIIESTIQLYIK